MPDWFYRTVSRPFLFALPAAAARSFALGFMGRLGALPFGLGVRMIDFLGHMRPDPRLRTRVFDLDFEGPVGLSPHLDPLIQATSAWTRFGFGFLEIGPVVADGKSPVSNTVRRDIDNETIWMPSPRSGPTLAELQQRLKSLGPTDPLVIVRIGIHDSTAPVEAANHTAALMKALQEKTACFTLAFPGNLTCQGWTCEDWVTFWRTLAIRRETDNIHRPVALVVSGEEDKHLPSGWEQIALQSNVSGLLVDGCQSIDGGCLYGRSSRLAVAKTVRELRELHGQSVVIIASGGIHQPVDADELLLAGANLIQIDTGLVFSGPGLVKRINESRLWKISRSEAGEPVADSTRVVERSWFWTALMGLGMLIGSILALIISANRVVLPYDEAFCGWTRQQIHEFNPRLLLFMSHDRVTLAGTMVAIGLLYLGLSLYGIRSGQHWAKVAVLISAGTGFFSFFLFLGFGYFDPFHGFVSAVLFQLFVQGVHGNSRRSLPESPEWTETAVWRRGQWGQLLLITHSLGLLFAGIFIAAIGVHNVLVAEDLNYLQMGLQSLRSTNPRIIPLIAHDRATLGGMLLSSGLVYLLASLWGVRRNTAWLWHTFLWSGLAAYVAAITVHFCVGYVDFHHLLPAFAGLVMLLLGLGLTSAWMRSK